MDPGPFLRGIAWPGAAKVPYPRAKPDDFMRLPVDTWYQAQAPVGVRLELQGDASQVEIAYRNANGKPDPHSRPVTPAFSSWRGVEKLGEAEAMVGEGVVRVPMGDVVYLPEVLRPEITSVEGIGGSLEPAPTGPRWVVYGDSIAAGWSASEPALGWVSRVSREHRLDAVNMGYNGSARGEIVSAEHVAELDADVVTICHGTNCWTRTPHSVGMVLEGTVAFLEIVRQGHPEAPILVVSPVLRPDAEETPNRLGATLRGLRAAIENVVQARIEAGDAHLELLGGAGLITEAQLHDGLHPDDDGHRAIAAAAGPRVAALAGVKAEA